MFQKMNPKIIKKLNSINYTKALKIFNEDFMKKHTKFNTISEFLQVSGARTIYDLMKPTPSLNKFVKENTDFENFYEMLQCAGTEFLKKNKLK